MLTQPMDILTEFPVRKSKRQKEAFRVQVQAYAEGLDYPVQVEKGSFGVNNVIIGNPETAEYLVTAHYDTPACIGIPNFITPTNFLAVLLYQMLVVGGVFLISAVVGATARLLLDESLMPLAALTMYWAILLLLFFGPANKSNANDNTSGVVTVLEVARNIPKDARDKVCFVLFDLEEPGLIGSNAYRKAHKAQTDRQMVLNLDCVGDGNELVFFPTKKLKKDEDKMATLRRITGVWCDKSISIREKGFAYFPSDQDRFPYGVGVAAFRRKKWLGIYCGRIHTWRDTILEITNVNILRTALLTLITGTEAEKKG